MSDSEFLNYKNGIFDFQDCCEIPNHSMMLVGYGMENDNNQNDNNLSYWILKNSWGKVYF